MTKKDNNDINSYSNDNYNKKTITVINGLLILSDNKYEYTTCRGNLFTYTCMYVPYLCMYD